MFTGSKSEQDAWTSRVEVILGLLEDSLLNGAVPNTKINFDKYTKNWLRNNIGSIETLSMPDSPNSNYTMKRKRSLSDSIEDRKLQKLSSSLADDIARSLSVSMEDDVDMSNHPINVYNRPSLDEEENPVPTLRRISMSGSTNKTSNMISSMDQWLEIQAQKNHIPIPEFKTLFHEKQKLLRHELELLQAPNQPFESIREHLSKVLRIADELSGDHALSFNEIFPEWTLYESRIDKLATYVQSVEDMSFSINNVIPQTNDLLQDIKGLQNTLDTKMALYGDALIQNGLEWKAMGMPVDDQLLTATREWLHNLCTGLLNALNNECKKARDMVNDMEDLLHLPIGEKLMASILAGLEFVSEASAFIGFTSQKLIYDCRVLASVYGQWVSENLEHINDKPTSASPIPIITTTALSPSAGTKKATALSINTNSTKRIDIRYMQLMDNITSVLTALYSLNDLEMRHQDILNSSSSIASAENLSSVLVELTVQAVGVIEVERSKSTTSASSKIAGNIMSNPQTDFIHMGESLLTFANKIIELAGRERTDGGRIQVLHTFLEELENTLESS